MLLAIGPRWEGNVANGGRAIPQGEFQDPIGDLLRQAKFEALLAQPDATRVETANIIRPAEGEAGIRPRTQADDVSRMIQGLMSVLIPPQFAPSEDQGTVENFLKNIAEGADPFMGLAAGQAGVRPERPNIGIQLASGLVTGASLIKLLKASGRGAMIGISNIIESIGRAGSELPGSLRGKTLMDDLLDLGRSGEDITPQRIEELIGSTRKGPVAAGRTADQIIADISIPEGGEGVDELLQALRDFAGRGGQVVGDIRPAGTGFVRRGQNPRQLQEAARREMDRPRTVLDNNIQNLLDEKDRIMRTTGELTHEQGQRSIQISHELDALFRRRGSTPRSNFGRRQRILEEEANFARGGPPDIGPGGRPRDPNLTTGEDVQAFFDEMMDNIEVENVLFQEAEAARRASSEAINREIFQSLKRADPFGEAAGQQENLIGQIEDLIMRRITPGQIGPGPSPAGLLGPAPDEGIGEMLRALLDAFNKPPG